MHVTLVTRIEVPPEALWPWLVEPERQKQWMHGVVSNERTEGDGKSVGSRFRMQIKEGGRVSDYEGTVVAYDEPRRLGVELVGGCGKTPMTMRATYVLTPEGGGTRLAYEGGGELPGFFAKLMMVFFFWMPKAIVKRFLRSLKRVAEAEAEARSG